MAIITWRQTSACCCCRILNKRHQCHFKLIREHLYQKSEPKFANHSKCGNLHHQFQWGTPTMGHLSAPRTYGPFCRHVCCRQISICSCLSVLFCSPLLSPASQLFDGLGTFFRLSCREKRCGGLLSKRRQYQKIPIDLNLDYMFHLTGRSKRSMLENLIEGDFKVALPNDPQNNPETLINILNNVFGKCFPLYVHVHYSKTVFHMFDVKFPTAAF